MNEMIEKRYKRKIEFQEKIIKRQSEQIEELKLQNQKLELKCKEKDEIINSVSFLREELKQNVDEIKQHKNEYKFLVDELRKMKEIVNQEVYKGRWKLIKFLIK